MEDQLTITLDPPLDAPGGPYAAIELREPTAGDLVETDGLEGYASDVRIISVIAGMPESAVRKIPARPFLQATRFISGFLKPAPPTGAAA